MAHPVQIADNQYNMRMVYTIRELDSHVIYMIREFDPHVICMIREVDSHVIYTIKKVDSHVVATAIISRIDCNSRQICSPDILRYPFNGF